MDDKIETNNTLWSLVDLDSENHKVKDITTLFLNAMNDWPTMNQTLISDFIEELKWRGMLHQLMPGTEEQLKKEVHHTII